jgi:hypothetical protein
MAQRRMFSKDIVRSDSFLDMPLSSQLLYFHLGMEADDDGFVDNTKMVSRMVGTGDDDIKILLSKRFLLSVDSGLIVIKHWKINNYIQADRYKATKYIEAKNMLKTKDNRAYTECIQTVSKLDAQTRLGKTSKDKKRLDKNTEEKEIFLNKNLKDTERFKPDFLKRK